MKQLKVSFVFLVVMFLFTCCKTNLGINDKSFIPWQNTKQLIFKDFKGNPKMVGTDLLGYCGTQYRFKHKIDSVSKLPKFSIKCYFNKKLSFLKNKKDTITLRHEQMHFNIGELFCRRTRKSWDSLYDLKEKKVSAYYKIKSKTHKHIVLLNKTFDKDAINGAILDASDSILKKWEVKIDEELSDLEKYKE